MMFFLKELLYFFIYLQGFFLQVAFKTQVAFAQRVTPPDLLVSHIYVDQICCWLSVYMFCPWKLCDRAKRDLVP